MYPQLFKDKAGNRILAYYNFEEISVSFFDISLAKTLVKVHQVHHLLFKCDAEKEASAQKPHGTVAMKNPDSNEEDVNDEVADKEELAESAEEHFIFDNWIGWDIDFASLREWDQLLELNTSSAQIGISHANEDLQL